EFGVGSRIGAEIIARGYERVVFITRSYTKKRSHYSHGDRENGLRVPVEKAGRPFEVLTLDWPDETKSVRFQGGPTLTFAELYETQLEARLRPEVAVVTLGETRANMVIRAASHLRRRVGEDFGLVTCDDLMPKMQAVWPDLTRVGYDRYAAG